MTTPTDAILDAFNAAADGDAAIDAAYSGVPAIMTKLTASRSRVVALFDEVAAHHSLSRAQLVALCNERAGETDSGGINCA